MRLVIALAERLIVSTSSRVINYHRHCICEKGLGTKLSYVTMANEDDSVPGQRTDDMGPLGVSLYLSESGIPSDVCEVFEGRLVAS